MKIESCSNNLIKQVLLLKDKKARNESGLFLIEGAKIFSEIPDDWEIETVFISENNVKAKAGSLPGCAILAKTSDGSKAETIIVSDRVIKKLSFTENPQDIIAVVKKKVFLKEEVLKKGGRFLILENMQDPGNLGTIIRSADAFNTAGIFISKNSADLYNDKVIRASMGSIFHIPVICGIELESFLKELKDKKIKTFAADIKARKDLKSLNFPQNYAFLIGNESQGLKQETVKLCDSVFKIKMPGAAQSLNAAIAASLIMYEAVNAKITSK
ncbi:MAG: RNA methyltransferase [Elusimicrobiota bacterium]|jgi:TrmH family RNA methyltransferase|nr:RNA methyltransferase [Elusimicrobiota bacterium]